MASIVSTMERKFRSNHLEIFVVVDTALHLSLNPRKRDGRRSRRPLADGFDRMSIGVDHKGGVIGRPILGSKARAPIISPAGPQGFGMESVHRNARHGIESNVKSGT